MALAAVIDRVGVPMSWSDLTISLRAIGERDCDGGGPELFRAELERFDQGESSWIVCPAIDSAQAKFRCDFATLSTWPIDNRIVGEGRELDRWDLLHGLCGLHTLSVGMGSPRTDVKDLLERITRLADEFPSECLMRLDRKKADGIDFIEICQNLAEDLLGELRSHHKPMAVSMLDGACERVKLFGPVV
ncbi:hypothetical protein [Promicromonospora sp. AC04]|uniref:hypothetical protein n=1 Tax=Promicromonospora sp. AC04 TaxID=2135723 RepID=UPI0011B1D235|nr:hypothetical protein [Promicromonospora sp. AC04]